MDFERVRGTPEHSAVMHSVGIMGRALADLNGPLAISHVYRAAERYRDEFDAGPYAYVVEAPEYNAACLILDDLAKLWEERGYAGDDPSDVPPLMGPWRLVPVGTLADQTLHRLVYRPHEWRRWWLAPAQEWREYHFLAAVAEQVEPWGAAADVLDADATYMLMKAGKPAEAMDDERALAWLNEPAVYGAGADAERAMLAARVYRLYDRVDVATQLMCDAREEELFGSDDALTTGHA